MEAANQVAAYISKLDQQPIRDHYLYWEILIYIRCKHKIYLDLKGLMRLSLKQILSLWTDLNEIIMKGIFANNILTIGGRTIDLYSKLL